MNQIEVIDVIAGIINRVLEDKGAPLPKIIGPETLILGGEMAIDSLDLATIVVEMEVLTGLDPFANGFISFRTVGELAALYSATSA